MTRIISGRAGGTHLEVPSVGTRPTSDRVRESLFGALEAADSLIGARVLDLYAGSGALGLESLSRGAASADLVEHNAAAAAAVQRNAAKVGRSMAHDAPIRVHRSTVAAFLRAPRGEYDLVFIDPPYDHGDDELTRALTALAPLLAPSAVVVVERSRHSPAPRWDEAGLVATRDRRYGDTTLWWGQPRAESQSR